MTVTQFASLITDSGIVLSINGKPYTIGNDHPNLLAIKNKIQAKAYDDLLSLIDVTTTVRRFLSSDPEFQLVGSLLSFQNRPFSDAVTSKVLSMIEAGMNAEPLFRFLRNVRLNPSHAAQNELLLFCVANQFMITDDGHILAYKSVRHDYTDIHSGKVLNKVGMIVEMPRNEVDDNRDRTCSEGLHFASHEYATTWHGRQDARLLLMKIHPRDVVSIPSDYNNQKGRTCRYEVIAEIDHNRGPLDRKEVYTPKDIAGPAIKVADSVTDAFKQACDAANHFNRRQRIESEIARKRDVLARWRAARAAADRKLTSLRQVNLTGASTSEITSNLQDQKVYVSAITSLYSSIERIRKEISILQDEIMTMDRPAKLA